MEQPSIPQLRAFTAVAASGHFGDAADELGITQPAVSSAVRGLERLLGAELFERSKAGALLTPLGSALIVPARQVLAGLDELVAESRRAGRPHSGPLRLGVIPTVAPYLLPTALRAFGESFPDLEPEVVEDRTASLVAGLAGGDLDVAVLALPLDDSALVPLPLYSEELILLLPAGHHLAGRDDVPLAELARLDVLLLEEGHCLRDQAVDVCRAAGALGRTARAASLSTLSQLVAAGLGVTLLPASAVPVEVRDGLSTARFAARPAPSRRLALVVRATSTRRAEYGALAGALREALTQAGAPVSVAGGAGAHTPS
ncbi:MAG TPA: hydrogen peroxide-inducible genes activator [Acidimicrobiales bacterium]|nr:hydrogen peroxide-inducible genes activator [Acidimicrobiales bacterium]